MKLAKKVALVSVIHYGFTMAIFFGAVFSQISAARHGLNEVGPVGELLLVTARTLVEPVAGVMTPLVDGQGHWIWTVPALNSLLWGGIIVLVFVAVRHWFGRANT
ncbi:hypothetical protein QQF73_19175 [Marinobacter sp. M216]|uniref:Uncharacterized protein n=1 Tax=Marinobacter albus TaxID=3030833 RepID=A0ABT7HJR3_9GAMM|nr:hypothetical protein [Marinobacter sp. M216]MDK9559761.1 hypothetical protein [Marinobacter sp. M216]